MRPRLLLHVQHLLGTGHLRRMAAIAEALAARGAEIVLVSGGTPLADLSLGDAEFVQLPPARAQDARFKTLMTPDGNLSMRPGRRRASRRCCACMRGSRPISS